MEARRDALTSLRPPGSFDVPQVRRAKAHESRQDPAGSSGKCGDRRCGSPGAFLFLPAFHMRVN
jgi:hypothetical protein